MSVYLYDDAVAGYFRNILGDTVMIQPPENAIRNTAQLEGDRMKFPLVSLNRTGYSIRSEEWNFNAVHQGAPVRIKDNNNLTMARTIPIRIEYQVDVFTVDKQLNDELTRQLVFYITAHPTNTVDVPYDIDIQHKYNIFLNPDIVDNSDTVNHVNNGVLFRTTFTMYCPDAYLWANKNVISPSLDVNLNIKKADNTLEEV
jgi:hypothetical protein